MTTGLIMFVAGIAIALICLILLPVLTKIFQNQRKQLMKKLESEM